MFVVAQLCSDRKRPVLLSFNSFVFRLCSLLELQHLFSPVIDALLFVQFCNFSVFFCFWCSIFSFAHLVWSLARANVLIWYVRTMANPKTYRRPYTYNATVICRNINTYQTDLNTQQKPIYNCSINMGAFIYVYLYVFLGRNTNIVLPRQFAAATTVAVFQ